MEKTAAAVSVGAGEAVAAVTAGVSAGEGEGAEVLMGVTTGVLVATGL